MKRKRVGSTKTNALAGRRTALKVLGGVGLAAITPAFLGACGGTVQTGPAKAQALGYRMVSVNAASTIGVFRSLQGVDGPPVPATVGAANIPPGTTPVANIFNPKGLDLTSVYAQMGVDFVRTHDLDAFGTGDLDGMSVNRIFPNWNSDPLDPASYNFGPTDDVIAGIVRSNSTVFFRFGRSDLTMVGLSSGATPPSDFDKYAAIAKQICLHYNSGWANGFSYDIKYWEVWNEPDLLPSWSGTPPQYYQLYAKVAAAIKSVDPTLKVGGPVIATNNDLTGLMGSFLQFVSTNGIPLDFYSFHWYPNFVDPYDFPRLAQEYRSLLNQYGFTSTELHLNEWNYSLFAPTPAPETLAAFIATSLSYMQDAPIDRACCYQRTAPLLQDDGSLTKAGSAFSAIGDFSAMTRLPTFGQDVNGYTVLAGLSDDKNEIRVLISNYQIPATDQGPIPGGDTQTIPSIATFTYLDRRTIAYTDNAGYYVVIDGLPWASGASTVNRYRIDSSRQMALVDTQHMTGGQCVLSSALPPSSVEVIVITAA